MLNVMEERDIQVRGYTLRLPLDVLVVASANPEDYTNRGRIITPLKDRFGAEIRTHYPLRARRRDRRHRAGGRTWSPTVPDVPAARSSPASPATLRESPADRPALRRLGAVRDRRRRDGRGRGAAPRRDRWARRSRSRGSSTSRPAIDVLRGKIEFESGEEGREQEVLEHLLRTATADTVPRAARRHRPAARSSTRSRTAPRSRPASGCRAREVLRGAAGARRVRPVRRDRRAARRAHGDGERASAHRARARGAVPGPADRQGQRRRGDRLWLRRRGAARVRDHRGTPRYDRRARPAGAAGRPARGARRDRRRTSWRARRRERALRELLRRGTPDHARVSTSWRAEVNASAGASCCSSNNLDGTLAGDQEAARRGGARRAQAAGPRPRRRRPVRRDAARGAAAVTGRRPSASSPTTTGAAARRGEKYEQIKDLLGRELLDQRFAGMKQALGERHRRGPRSASTRCSSDLNDLLDKHARGEDTDRGLRTSSWTKHGEFFPENPQNIDELLDSLAKRAAAAQRMLATRLTPEQRAELDALAQQAFGSPGADERSSTGSTAPAGGCGPARTGTARQRFSRRRAAGHG